MMEYVVLQEPDLRKILWYYDARGKSGKTFISKWMEVSLPEAVVGPNPGVDGGSVGPNPMVGGWGSVGSVGGPSPK